MTTYDATSRIEALELDNHRLREALDRETNAQLTHEDIKTMTAQERMAAFRAGRLADILGKPNPDRQGGYKVNGDFRSQPQDVSAYIRARQEQDRNKGKQ